VAALIIVRCRRGISPAASGSAGSADYLPLSDEQRGRIFDGIMKLRGAPAASVPPTASALPNSVALQDLPASITNEMVCRVKPGNDG
jgi:hypothetical protein